MTKILGIDPGKKGALAVLNKDELSVITYDMPDTTTALHELLCEIAPVKLCALEKTIYPHQIGTSNVAKIAEAYGTLKGALAWLNIPTFEAPPSKWKAALNVPANKDAARQRASEFFPACADQWPLKKHDGRAEAALIAWYGLRWA